MWSEIGVVFGYAAVGACILVVVLLVVALFVLSIGGDYKDPPRGDRTETRR
ncbi:adenylate cyclase [Rhodococcus triatomae]|uniref:Uncharacterized protein n=1 Tax=Rhodococcus triatomae TaxID=300028 RepID=A0A1G8K4W6_9NOCA|nr:adenylate cyclase [Rhodococcus triatomae]QNG18825.1 adenylate cyclase [Rhodococcus triatomae]QNG25264.1 adenylate cyclase [Rhodococcus triatomae]SDI38471.1 hypothetical protein SAMN05444695_10725 [Rhodococcus triatomae]